MLCRPRRLMVPAEVAASPVPIERAIVLAAVKVGLEALSQPHPSACRPILTATARDGALLERPG